MRRLEAGHAVMAVLAGLALAPARAVAQNPTTMPGNAGGWNSRFIPNDLWTRMLERKDGGGGGAFVVTAPADSVWTALTDVMKQLDVPLGFSDRPAGEMGTVKAKAYKRFAKSAISDYFRCGEGINGPNADTYVVYLSAAAVMKAGPNGAVTILPVITGDAIDLPNGRNDLVPCTTSGHFEERFAKAVRKRLGLRE